MPELADTNRFVVHEGSHEGSRACPQTDTFVSVSFWIYMLAWILDLGRWHGDAARRMLYFFKACIEICLRADGAVSRHMSRCIVHAEPPRRRHVCALHVAWRSSEMSLMRMPPISPQAVDSVRKPHANSGALRAAQVPVLPESEIAFRYRAGGINCIIKGSSKRIVQMLRLQGFCLPNA